MWNFLGGGQSVEDDSWDIKAVLPQPSSSNLLLKTSVIASAALAGTYMIAKGYNDLQESESVNQQMLGVAAMVSGLAVAGLGMATVNYL